MNRIVLFLATAIAAIGQLRDFPTNRTLGSNYYFRHLMFITNSAGGVQEVRSSWGEITFYVATGTFEYRGSQMTGDRAAEAFSGQGTYDVKPTGIMKMTNPMRPSAQIVVGLDARSFEAEALIGSSIESPAVSDLFVAVQILPPRAEFVGDYMTGAYDVSLLEIPAGAMNLIRVGSFRMTAATQNAMAPITVNLKSADSGGRPIAMTISNVTFTAQPNGTGYLNLPRNGPLQGNHSFALGQSGTRTLLLGSNEDGMHSIWIATRVEAEAGGRGTFGGPYFRAGLRYEPGAASSYFGSLRGFPGGTAVTSLRNRSAGGVKDVMKAMAYSFGLSATGTLDSNHLVSHSSGNRSHLTSDIVPGPAFEFSIGIGMPREPLNKIVPNPQGIVNAASFAPLGAPLAPGTFFSIFGTGFATATTVATSLPFPTSLGGAQVLINDAAVPLYLVSATQISALVPLEVTGTTATVTLVIGGQRTNTVEVPVAPTAPGIFTIPPAGFGPGAILHADFTVVSAASPARPGETVQLFLTGLGAVTPRVNIGALAPANPLSTVNADVRVLVGGQPAQVLYKGLAPNLAGLYQLNFTVPMNAPTGDAVRLTIDTANATHQMADIAVR